VITGDLQTSKFASDISCVKFPRRAAVIDALVSAVVEVLFEGTGRRLLGLFGKQPHSVVMLFTGMAFWIVPGIILYRAFH